MRPLQIKKGVELANIGRKRFLIISYSYTPFLNPRSFRWTAIAEKWVQQGGKVDLVCSWLPGLSRCEVVNGVQVHRVGGGIIEILRSKFSQESKSASEDKNSTNSSIVKKSRFKSLIMTAVRLIHDIFWKNLYWPDYACTWIGPASNKALELCRTENYSAIISVSDPFSSHLAGRKVKSDYPQVIWLVDIGDPFCFRDDIPVNNLKLYKNLNIKVEREIFKEADSISVTCQPTADEYVELFPEFKNKIEVIPPLLSITPGQKRAGSFFPASNSLRILYIGTLYRSIRSPEFLLKLFAMLSQQNPGNRIELHFVGAINRCEDLFEQYRQLIGNQIFLHGQVDRDSATCAMEEADLLVNIGNGNRYQLPSKIVEYASLGKPILNLSTIDEDSSQLFLKDYAASLNLRCQGKVPSESDVIEVMNFIRGIPYKFDQSYLYELRESFGIEAISESYSYLLNPGEIHSDSTFFPLESEKENKQYALSEQQERHA